MQSAAGQTGLKLAELKAAKRAGCPAFKPGSRVDLDELREWLAAQPDPVDNTSSEELEPKETLERRRLKAQYLTIEHRRQVELGKYILKEDRDKADTRNASAVKSELLKLANEVPNWAGYPAHEIKTRIDAAILTICENLHNMQSDSYKEKL